MYNYQTERTKIFTEEGQEDFLRIRDHVQGLLRKAGAFTMARAFDARCSGDTWTQIACVDRLVELGEIREVKQPNYIAGQDRIFVKGGE